MLLKIYEIKNRDTNLINTLVNLWEESVKSTHTFLSSSEIENIKQYVPEAIKNVPYLFVALNENNIVGFIGINNKKIEMLFVSKQHIGIGKLLLNYGIENYFVNEVTVNEENINAKGFYEHFNFRVYKRSEFEEQNNHYPILYMVRK